MSMFSDRYRIAKIAGLAILLAALAWYADAAQKVLTYSECLSDPERFDGKEVPIFMEARILETTPGSIRISQPDGPLDLLVPPHFQGMVPAGASLEDVKPGQSLEAVAVFRRPRFLELKAFRSAQLRKFKIFVSIFPVVLVAFFLFRTIRWENGRLIIKEVPKVNFSQRLIRLRRKSA
ncbi:MAG: hypothetical protein V1789_12570 [PVC group bacterium]